VHFINIPLSDEGASIALPAEMPGREGQGI
jgi:hypothetical protein